MEDVFPDEYVDLGKRRLLTRHLEHISGLPFVCNNCGVSFFSLRSIEDEDECYCSGECKWSVIMYREMDRRMYALRQSESYESSYDQESEYYESYQCLDDVISCR
ncbi:TPA: hypothetical protein N0F65_001310 [Lagenidium giganteum]|uniref:Uncharacterized protein n=1 Tax=Lagenidium giganteum TaxID=4803 RepID=A0AAV2Z2T8_9STRA|nr:TPA: hypothetical protein N0F65_001310 [Lagenidium giganteum]